MFNNKGLKVMASLLFGSMVVLLGGERSAYADFDYSEHQYKTYNSAKEDVSGKEAYLASIPDLNNSIPANDYILELERVAAKANGLLIGNYTQPGDYKKIVQPMRISIGRTISSNFGNYQILLGTQCLKDYSGYEYNRKQNRNPQMDAGIIWLMGHEIGHGVLNHGTGRSNNRVEPEERDADRIAWYTLEKTSDYGWGYAFTVNDAYRTDNCNSDYITKQTNNKLRITGTSPSNVVYSINTGSKWYNARNLYDILLGNYFAPTPVTDYGKIYDSYAKALGQLGYIYSKEKTIDVNKITIVPETKYPYLKSKLVYKSANMPNGYKTITFFFSDVDKVFLYWNKSPYDSNEGFSSKTVYNDIVEMQSMISDSLLQKDMAQIIAIKYAGIDLFNGINYFH